MKVGSIITMELEVVETGKHSCTDCVFNSDDGCCRPHEIRDCEEAVKGKDIIYKFMSLHETDKSVLIKFERVGGGVLEVQESEIKIIRYDIEAYTTGKNGGEKIENCADLEMKDGEKILIIKKGADI